MSTIIRLAIGGVLALIIIVVLVCALFAKTTSKEDCSLSPTNKCEFIEHVRSNPGFDNYSDQELLNAADRICEAEVYGDEYEADPIVKTYAINDLCPQVR